MSGKPSILVLSAHTSPRTTAPINHAAYCDRHGYAYAFDVTPYRVTTGYDQKFCAILAHLHRADWMLWIDDDAFFTDLTTPLEHFLPSEPDVHLVFCDSPINMNGQWTLLNSGVFFIRSSQCARDLLLSAREADLSTVREWWKPELGLFTNGDQDQLVYTLTHSGQIDPAAEIRPHAEFNSRISQYASTATDHFICHLAGHVDKKAAVRSMQRFGLDQHMLPPGSAADYRHSMFFAENAALPRIRTH